MGWGFQAEKERRKRRAFFREDMGGGVVSGEIDR